MAHVFNRIFTYIGWQAKRKVSFILAQGCDLWEGQDRIKGSDGAGKKPDVKVGGHLCGRQAKSQRELIRQ